MTDVETHISAGLPQELLHEARQNCTPITDDYFDKYITSSYDRTIAVSVANGVICAIGLLANFFVLFLLFAGGRNGAIFNVPSTILVLNLGEFVHNL